MASRLRGLLPALMCSQQSSSVQHRSTFSGLLLTRDAFSYATHKRSRGLRISLDQTSAFDRLEHGYLFAVMRDQGFPRLVLAALKSLYAGVQSSLLLNGVPTAPFEFSRGVRQGCPLSPVLFILALESLLRRAEAHPSIRGLSIP